MTNDAKLIAVLARVCERLGPIFKTQAVKFPYLVDLVAQNTLGHPITSGTHQAWEHGVVTQEAWTLATYELPVGFERQNHGFSESGFKLACTNEPSPSSALDDRERAVVDFVTDTFGDFQPGDLGQLTKMLNPELPRSAWGTNQQASLGEDAYARLNPLWMDYLKEIERLDLANPNELGTAFEEDPEPALRAALGL